MLPSRGIALCMQLHASFYVGMSGAPLGSWKIHDGSEEAFSENRTSGLIFLDGDRVLLICGESASRLDRATPLSQPTKLLKHGHFDRYHHDHAAQIHAMDFSA
jgi:hypothetical protein